MIHFFMKVHSILYISALLSACLQKISEADSASKWVEIVSEVQRIEFSLNTNSPFSWYMNSDGLGLPNIFFSWELNIPVVPEVLILMGSCLIHSFSFFIFS